MSILTSLLIWQFSVSPDLQRSTHTQRAIAEIQRVINESNSVHLVEANVRFTPPNIDGQNTLLCLLYVQRQSGVTESSTEISDRITQTIQQRLLNRGFDVTPLVDVSVLEVPD